MIDEKQPVLFIVPPFQSVLRPAIGVSQIKANLLERGINAEILYLNLRFADILGVRLYEKLNSQFIFSLGDYIFSCLLFDYDSEQIERYVGRVLRKNAQSNAILEVVSDLGAVKAVKGLVGEARTFIEKSVKEIVERDPWIVGLTSSVQDNLSSLLLIRRIKEKNSGILTAMGGPNCQGIMGVELYEQFPEIDYMGQGECDLSFVDLVEHIHDGDNEHQIPGILSRTAKGKPLPSPMLSSEELEKSPFPDFHDFFDQAAVLQSKNKIVPGLLMEASRGCYWGEKVSCRFCGLNGEQIAFRTKTGSRALSEVREQTKQYKTSAIEMVDKMVDKKYFTDFFPILAESQDARFFWETSGSLPKDQIHSLAAANVMHIQAGLESLSNRSLRLMGKPTTTMHNLQMLKWCSETGIAVSWTHLFGVPGESEEEVAELVSMFQLLHHLRPPRAAHIVRLQRFSEYFNSPEEYGLLPNSPVEAYRYIYPFSEDVLNRIALHFTTEFSCRKSEGSAYEVLGDAVGKWRRGHKRAHLIALPNPEYITVIDTRKCARRHLFRLSGLRRQLYECCDRARALPRIMKELESDQSEAEIKVVLQSLVNDRLMLCLDERYFSLATEYGKSYLSHSIFDGWYKKRMPGGHIGPIKKRELLQLYRRLHVSLWRLAVFVLRKSPEIIRFIWQEGISAVCARKLRAEINSRSCRKKAK